MHDAVDDVGLADEVSHKGVFGLVIDILGGTDLLDTPFIHDTTVSLMVRASSWSWVT